MKYYLIDGYNVIFHQKNLGTGLQKAREELIRLIKKQGITATIVFDGKGEELSERGHNGSLEVVYTGGGQTADCYILAELSWIKNPMDYIVVTSDKKIAVEAKSTGAQCQTSQQFVNRLEKKQKQLNSKQEKPMQDTDKNIQRLLQIFNNRF